jgi:Tfp pilus assembly protein PilE
MKKIENNGFTLVEGLIIVFVLALIGFAGYYTFNRQNHKATVVSTSKPSSPKINDSQKVLDAAYAYCKTFDAAGKMYSFYLSTAKDSPNKGISVVYSENKTKAVVDGACYDTASQPNGASVYSFKKDSGGNWSIDTSAPTVQ